MTTAPVITAVISLRLMADPLAVMMTLTSLSLDGANAVGASLVAHTSPDRPLLQRGVLSSDTSGCMAWSKAVAAI